MDFIVYRSKINRIFSLPYMLDIIFFFNFSKWECIILAVKNPRIFTITQSVIKCTSYTKASNKNKKYCSVSDYKKEKNRFSLDNF